MTNFAQVGQRALELLEEATQAEAGDTPQGQVLKEMEGWDSMGMVLFIGLVTEHLGVELSVHDLRESATAADLCGRVEALSDS